MDDFMAGCCCCITLTGSSGRNGIRNQTFQGISIVQRIFAFSNCSSLMAVICICWSVPLTGRCNTSTWLTTFFRLPAGIVAGLPYSTQLIIRIYASKHISRIGNRRGQIVIEGDALYRYYVKRGSSSWEPAVLCVPGRDFAACTPFFETKQLKSDCMQF